MHFFSVLKFWLHHLVLLFHHIMFFTFLIKKRSLSLALLSKISDFLCFLLRSIIFLFKLTFLFLKFHKLQLCIIRSFPFLLELHLLIPKCFFKICELFKVPLIVDRRSAHLVLLLHEHLFLHVGLLELLSQPQAFVDIDGELYFDLVWFWHLDVTF